MDFTDHPIVDRRLMALFPQRFIDDLRLQASIVQVVQECVR
jgi:hypothetical protein